MNVFVVRGCSGSGKSRLTAALQGLHQSPFLLAWWKDRASRTATVSADYFYETRNGCAFDATLLPTAHAGCLRSFDDQLRSGEADLVVDNTNTTIAEVAPYIALGLAREATMHVITLIGDPVACWRRSRHGVDLAIVLRQDLELRKSILEWPPWWPFQHVMEAGT